MPFFRLLSASILLMPAVSHAQSSMCDPIGNCDPGSHWIQPEPRDGEGGDCDSLAYCEINLVPPPAPTLPCISDVWFYNCSVWPRSEGYTYTWQATGPLQLGLPNGRLPYQSVQCLQEGEGRVRLTVTSPYGTYSTREFPFFCEITLLEPTPPDQPVPGPVDDM